MCQYGDTLPPIDNIAMTRRQIPMRRNLATWNSAIYCTQVACDTLIVSLR